MKQRSMTLPVAFGNSVAGLCAAYGPQRVAQWEAEGRARVDAKKQRVEDMKRKMGQIK